MQYYLWNLEINGEKHSIFTIATNLEDAKLTAVRNAPKACREEIRAVVEKKPHIIKGPYSFLVKAEVDFECKDDHISS
jgi:hypothetical protein